MSDAHRAEQQAQAEELLGDRLEQAGFAKGLFFGQFLREQLVPYPDFSADEETTRLCEQLRQFCIREIDPVAIDRQSEIPSSVIRGLGDLGLLGACLPTDCGGRGLSQTAYCRLMEVLGGHCGSTALFVNAHHSIGPRAIVLFGTTEQQQRWLPSLATGESISAFALTEPEAGSDAANVQTRAEPTSDGQGFLVNGEKRWITNGGLADVLTVIARTPDPGKQRAKSEITALLVTPDMPGFQVVEKRMDKCGVRGTATSRLAFHDMFVPKGNVLGQPGKGLKVALTVLDYGRTTFGASCSGAAKFCAVRAIQRARQRVQFGQPLASFELVKAKIAAMQAGAFAIESATYQTAALMDAGVGDFILETAMLKVFSTEVLWDIINDTIQIYGGKAYFTDEPFERMMRDARINTIGEGANDVLRVFAALVGIRNVGLEWKELRDGLRQPFSKLTKIGRFASRKLGTLLVPPAISVRSAELEADAAQLARQIRSFSRHVDRLLATYQEEILDRQYCLARVADAATEIYVSACVINRLDARPALPQTSNNRQAELATGRYYLQTASQRIRSALRQLWDNNDRETTWLADRWGRAQEPKAQH